MIMMTHRFDDEKCLLDSTSLSLYIGHYVSRLDPRKLPAALPVFKKADCTGQSMRWWAVWLLHGWARLYIPLYSDLHFSLGGTVGSLGPPTKPNLGVLVFAGVATV